MNREGKVESRPKVAQATSPASLRGRLAQGSGGSPEQTAAGGVACATGTRHSAGALP